MIKMTASAGGNRTIAMDLNTWRGYSAYEIAVQNGFEGSESEWLESLKGKDGSTTSVNGIEHQLGSITLTGADIAVAPDDSRRLSDLAAPLDKLAGAVTITEDGVDLGGRYLDNALFR